MYTRYLLTFENMIVGFSYILFWLIYDLSTIFNLSFCWCNDDICWIKMFNIDFNSNILSFLVLMFQYIIYFFLLVIWEKKVFLICLLNIYNSDIKLNNHLKKKAFFINLFISRNCCFFFFVPLFDWHWLSGRDELWS